MVIILCLYVVALWLVFSKFKLVRWGWLSGTISLLVGGFILATFLALFNYLTPSGRVTVTGRVVEVTPNVTGQIVTIPVKPNVPVKTNDVLFQIDPAPFQGVLPLPFSSLKSAFPVLGNPANRNRAVPLTYDQFRYGFANAVSEDEAQALYKEFAVPAPGAPLFQAATANFNPWSEAKVDSKNPERGPLLIISGEKDHTVPWSIANASFKRQQHNESNVTEIVEIKGRGHALTIDSGWREVAETALSFVKRFL